MTRRLLRPNSSLLLIAVLCTLALARGLPAQDLTVDLDPTATKIDFTLAATMHTVHGTFKLKSSRIRFDPSTGKMAGSIVIDATSGDTGNSSQDAKMHSDILESKQFPEIIFMPNLAKGPLIQMLNQQKAAHVEVAGLFRLHGQDHDVTLTLSVEPGPAGRMDISTEFTVPYVEWGLKNPSDGVLHVADTVEVNLRTRGRIVISP
jgi:polyisoprenoid-binding protein YceI